VKAILEFNLPEESDEHLTAVKATDWQMTLWDVDQRLREIVKHGDDDTKADWAQELRDYIYEQLNERGLTWSP
jgi:3-methyladenine DNA glycosylase AlkC